MTRRRSAYRSLASLQSDNRRCRACTEAGFPLESQAVLEGHLGQFMGRPSGYDEVQTGVVTATMSAR